jgi:uncharacterized protein YkwD
MALMTTVRTAMMALVALLALCAAARAQNPDAESAAAEQELFRMTNRDRAEAGLAALEWNEWLAQAARRHAAEMARHGRLSHQFAGEPDLRERIVATAIRFDASAENVAFGPNTESINHDWMLSPGHRANILDANYNAVGVAVVRSGDTLFAVTDFAHTVPALSASDVESAVAVALNRVRAQKRLSPLAWRQDPALRNYACHMAKDDRVDANGLLGHGSISASLAFNDPNPANFASHFRNLANVTNSRSFSVGACFARTSTYPEGTNWIVVAFY